MKAIRIRASCPCEACARLAGVTTIRVAEDRRPAPAWAASARQGASLRIPTAAPVTPRSATVNP